MNSKTLSRQRAATAQKYGLSIEPQQAGESDLQYYKRLAHQADWRLGEIEKLTDKRTKKYDANYLMMKQFAYAEAQSEIRQWTGDKHKRLRFERSIPTNADGTPNQQELHKRTRAVERFLMSPTSLKSKIKKVYSTRTSTFNRRYGTNFTWDEFAQLTKSGQFASLKDTYGSPQFLFVIATLQKLKKGGGSKANKKKTLGELLAKTMNANTSAGQREIEKFKSQYGDDVKNLTAKQSEELNRLKERVKLVDPENATLSAAIKNELDLQGFTEANFSFDQIDLTINLDHERKNILRKNR